MQTPIYQRILLKLSGESLMGGGQFGVDPQACLHIASQIQQISRLGVQVGIVIGGGNIFRGAHASSMARTPADHIGMLATIINGISLQQAFERVGCESRIMSSIACDVMTESYSWKNALKYLEKKLILIFVGGTGNPYFTTDSAASLRALEIQAEVVLKATKVDGVYDADPLKTPHAKKFQKISYNDVLAHELQVMDATAIALCRENGLPIRVFNLFEQDALVNVVCNPSVGTLVAD